MVFYVKGLTQKIREKYQERLNHIEGAIGVLEEISGGKEFVWDTNFDCIYNSVFDYIKREESLTGKSRYRSRLDEIDEELNEIFRERRGNVIPREKKRMLSMVAMAGVE